MSAVRRASWTVRIVTLTAAVVAALPGCGTDAPAEAGVITATSAESSIAVPTATELPSTSSPESSLPGTTQQPSSTATIGGNPSSPRTTTHQPGPGSTTATTAATTTTAAPSYPVYSACSTMDIGVPNGWRATEGVPALSASSSLRSSACAWSLHMAQVGAASHSGAGAEVIQATGNFSWSWAGWKSSPSHYGILTSAGASQIGCGAVKVVRDAFHYEWYATCQLQ
jgi:uncharacterized protein YkwD